MHGIMGFLLVNFFCNSIVPFSRPLPGVRSQVRNRVLFVHVQITGVCSGHAEVGWIRKQKDKTR